MLAILLCGYGVGFLVGERTTRMRLAQAPAQPDWSTATVERLTRELTLSSAQHAAIKAEVDLAAASIAATRHQAIRRYRSALIDLHQRLLPHLDANQRKRVDASCRQLQLSLDKDSEPSNWSGN